MKTSLALTPVKQRAGRTTPLIYSQSNLSETKGYSTALQDVGCTTECQAERGNPQRNEQGPKGAASRWHSGELAAFCPRTEGCGFASDHFCPAAVTHGCQGISVPQAGGPGQQKANGMQCKNKQPEVFQYQLFIFMFNE